MKKLLLALIMTLSFACVGFAAEFEYKIVPLGSLTSLQKAKNPEAKTSEVEAVLNKYGKDGWELSEIFAVRTTFDPNVFFVIMKREK